MGTRKSTPERTEYSMLAVQIKRMLNDAIDIAFRDEKPKQIR